MVGTSVGYLRQWDLIIGINYSDHGRKTPGNEGSSTEKGSKQTKIHTSKSRVAESNRPEWTITLFLLEELTNTVKIFKK